MIQVAPGPLFWSNWSYKGRCFLVDDHLNVDSAQAKNNCIS